MFCSSHCSCTIFILTDSLHKQVVLLLILIDAHYLQISFEKGSGGKNNFWSDSRKLIKRFSRAKFPIPPTGGMPHIP